MMDSTKEEELFISSNQGKIKGIQNVSSYSEKFFYSFLGIPYAEPPIGRLRFQAPQLCSEWQSVLDATREKSACIHFSPISGSIEGSEDCLYLNVHIPEWPDNNKPLKAVIVNVVTNAGFAIGSSAMTDFGSPDFMIHHDVIYVTFNFRLHILGFLNLGIPECSGNAGLKDVVMVFQWVKKNISHFGGDPNNITAHGASSSASTIHLMMMSPLAKGLFNKAIMQGGFAFNTAWSFQHDPIERALALAKIAGCNDENPVKVLKFFLKLKAVALVKICGDLRRMDLMNNPGVSCFAPIRPSVELIKEGAFLSVHPRNLVHSIEKIPVICGFCQKEGLFIYMVDPTYELNKNFKNVVKKNLWMYDIDDNELDRICRQIKSFYFKHDLISNANHMEIADLYTDFWFNEYYMSFIDVLINEPDSKPVYTYHFTYNGNYSYLKIPLEKVSHLRTRKPIHFDDGTYCIKLRMMDAISDSDRRVIDTMGKLWTNFAKNGNPNTDVNLQWEPTKLGDHNYLNFKKTPTIAKGRINEKRFEFWEKIIQELTPKIQ